MSMTIADAIRLEGKLEAVHGLLMKLGRRKFGEPDAATLRTFQAIADLERLDRMSTSILDSNSWSELLAAS